MPNTIKEIMREVQTIKKDKTLFDALQKMIEKKTNSLVVIDDDERVIGIVNTGRLLEEIIPDYLEDDEVAAHFATKEIFEEDVKKAKDSLVEKFMIKDPKIIKGNESLMKVAVLALSNRQMRIPVVDDNQKLIGLITRTELKQVVGEILGIKNS